MRTENSTGENGANTWDTTETEPLVFEDVDPDHPVFTTKHELRRTPQGRRRLVQTGVSMKGYKRGRGDYSSIPFTERRFCAWDGESVNVNRRTDHVTIDEIEIPFTRADSQYVLFGNSDGDYISGPNLSSAECLKLLVEKADKDAIHFGFAFGYDVNMIVRDLSKNHLRLLKENNHVQWMRWRIEYIPRKWLMVTDRYTRKTTKIWDVFSFFMKSAVDAWQEYGVEVSEAVIRGKLERGDLPYEQLWTDIYPYWKEENDAYVTLMEKLRETLHSADLYISAWHGPGAIASYSMSRARIAGTMATCPEPVNLAAQYAYGGGRFEDFKIGRATIPVLEYDIRSAYPYAISQLPNLARGQWRHVLSPDRIARFGVYRIKFAVNPFDPISNFHRPMPFFHRNPRGQISFPCVNETWVWSPELWNKNGFPGLEILEGWEFEEYDPTDRPFAWLAHNYDLRRILKNKGDAAQLALKLQMNSMYGKMAQRVGWNEKKLLPPKWHQLEWAGWVTSYCRAMVFRAALHAGRGLVAFETDAVFTTRPLTEFLDIGTGLGQWEEIIYDDFVYLQSGCRFGLYGDQHKAHCGPKCAHDGWGSKYRGFDKGSLSLDETLAALAKDPVHWSVTGTTKRFVGFAQALHQDFGQWREFQSGKARALHIGGEGKRQHMSKLCAACVNGIPGSEGFHDCSLAVPIGGESTKHMLPWKDVELLETQYLATEERHDILI